MVCELFDDCWNELKVDSMPNLGENNEKLVKFLEYLEKTWIKETDTFPISIKN